MTMKIAISVPDGVHRAVDRAARRRGVARSQIYVQAVEVYLQKEAQDGVTERLNAVYAGEDTAEDAFLATAARRTARRNK